MPSASSTCARTRCGRQAALALAIIGHVAVLGCSGDRDLDSTTAEVASLDDVLDHISALGPIGPGDTGPEVAWVQQRLIAHGFGAGHLEERRGARGRNGWNGGAVAYFHLPASVSVADIHLGAGSQAAFTFAAFGEMQAGYLSGSYDQFEQCMAEIVSRVPLFPTAGNHDLVGGGENYRDYIDRQSARRGQVR